MDVRSERRILSPTAFRSGSHGYSFRSRTVPKRTNPAPGAVIQHGQGGLILSQILVCNALRALGQSAVFLT
jgi:hypothetical protein